MPPTGPWHGTHQVGIGASLGKALKARKNGGEAGTSSPAPSTGPGKGRRNLPDREFYSLRYQHKPASIDSRKPGRIQFTTKEGSTTPSIVIEQASNQPNESVMFTGQEIGLNKLDCVIIYDEDTGTFTLEKLDGGLKVSQARGLESIMPRDSSPSSSTPSPDPVPSHSRTTAQPSANRRKVPSERDALNDIDDEIAAAALDSRATPRSGPSKPSRPQKEEEEEDDDEEELSLLQQQRIQQDQRRKQKEEQEERERVEALRKQEEERAEAARREQERIREQKEELRQLKQKHEQEKKEKEEEEKRRREKELQAQKEREQLAREQERRRQEQQQQEQQQRPYISTNKPKVKGAPKKKMPNPFMPKGTATSSSSTLPQVSSSRPLPKRPADSNPGVEEFGTIVPQRPTKVSKTKPSQTATSPPRPYSSGGLVLPGSSQSTALAPEPMLPSAHSIQRYGQKVKAAPPPAPPPAPVAPPPEPQEMEDSDDEGDWEPVSLNANGDMPSRVATPVAQSGPDVDEMADEIFRDLFEEEDPNAEDASGFDLENELEMGLEEAGLGPTMSDSDDDMEPVSTGVLPMDQDGPPMSLNQMLGEQLGGLPEPDTDYSSSSDEDSDY